MRTGRVDVRYLPRGFTYIGLLLFIAISGIGLAAVGQVWKTEAQREREKELLFVGEQYARAIASYYEGSPGGAKQYPKNLDDLLLDDRYPVVKRHLRKLFRDPVTGSDEWGLLRDRGRIVGVYSQSEKAPIRRQGFSKDWAGFDAAEHYSDWKFTLATVQLSEGPDSSVGATASHTGLTAPSVQGAGKEISPQAAVNVPVSDRETASTRTEPQPAAPESKRSEGYAECQIRWADENARCRATCGGGAACTACFSQSFTAYRACLRGG